MPACALPRSHALLKALAASAITICILACAVDAQASGENVILSDGTCPSTSNAGQYFDPTSYSCVACPTGMQGVSAQPTCACPPSHKEVSEACEACPENHMRSLSLPSICLPCNGSALSSAQAGDVVTQSSYDSSTTTCTCPGGYILDDQLSPGNVSTNGGMFCRSCPSNSVSSSDGSTCISCADPLMVRDSSNTCVCPIEFGLVAVNGFCVDSSAWSSISGRFAASAYASLTYGPTIDANNAEVSTFEVTDSLLMKELFPAAAASCLKYKDATEKGTESSQSCQSLANLCVLAGYDEDHPACSLLTEFRATEGITQYNFDDWTRLFPWVVYDKEGPLEAPVSTRVARTVALAGEKGFLNFTLSSFDVNGTWLGFESLQSQLVQCPASQDKITSLRRFGTNADIECTLDVESLYNASKSIHRGGLKFYELFLNDDSNALYPVPVVDLTLQQKNAFPNTGADKNLVATNVLTRRFIVSDFASGLKLATQSGSSTAVESAVAVKLATKIQLRVTLRSASDNTIYPPMLFIEYQGREMPFKQQDARQATVSTHSQYTMNLDNFWRTQEILLILSLVVIAFRWLVTAFSIVRAQQSTPLSSKEYLHILAELLGTTANIFFVWIFLVTGYWWVFFKLQADVSILLPVENPPGRFVAILIVSGVFKVLHALHITWSAGDIDIFLMDWEKPSPSSSNQPQEVPAVSIWRTLFVANEWNELQDVRDVSLQNTLIISLFFLVGLKWQYVAVPHPDERDLSEGNINWMIDFFFSQLIFWAVALVQLVYARTLKKQFIEDILGQFVDLLSLANVSIFILDSRFHGYYLHGRSVHERADCTMLDMARQIKTEEDGMVPKRGLDASSEDQVFEVYLNNEARHAYDEKFGKAMEAVVNDSKKFGGALPNKEKSSSAGQESLVKAKHALNVYLKDVVDTVAVAGSSQLQEKPYVHRLLNLHPEMAGSDKPRFFIDQSNAFARVLPVGHELDLLLFESLLFAMFRLATGDLTVAAVITMLIADILAWLRHQTAESNLATKSLVDSRFLI